MKLKKVLSLVLATSLAATALVGCGSNNANNGDGVASEEGHSDILIGFVTDEGGVNDKSFNQSGWEGVQRAMDEYGVEANYIESNEESEYIENLEAFVNQGADLVVACGFKMVEAVDAVASANPETNFLLVDEVVDLPNVKSITFDEHEGSFLVGVIAGLMTETNRVGFIGGYDMPLINKFEAGFAAGVQAVNPEAAEGIINRTDVIYADSFDDVNKGTEIANSLYDSGVDVVYHAAGGVGIGLFTAADQRGDVWAIGVDQDQADALPEYADIIASSMMKRVDQATYMTVVEIVNGEFEAGLNEMGLEDDGVGVAETSSNNVPADILEEVEAYMEQIINGDITVPSTLEELN